VVFLSLFIGVIFCMSPNIRNLFNEFWSSTISMLTFITAVFIGIFNIYTNWKNALEKRLTVFFVYYFEPHNLSIDPEGTKFIQENNLIEKTPYCLMVCEEAFLAHDSDIRNWAQQLGRQFEGGQNLSFHAFLTLGKNNAIVKKIVEGKSFYTRQYTVFMFLDKIPKCVIRDKNGILSTDNYDDKPTSKRENFPIKEIDYKECLEYEKAKEFIKGLKP